MNEEATRASEIEKISSSIKYAAKMISLSLVVSSLVIAYSFSDFQIVRDVVHIIVALCIVLGVIHLVLSSVFRLAHDGVVKRRIKKINAERMAQLSGRIKRV